MIDNKCVNYGKDEFEIVRLVLECEDLSGKSKFIQKYEENLSRYFKSTFAIAVNNATLGIKIALQACNVKRGDDVLITPVGPVMSGLPILDLGANAIFVDTEINTFKPSLQDIKNKITPKTKALIFINMWGYPFDISDILEFCHSKNVLVVEDASHSHGAKFNNKCLGTFGDIGVFSTHERKMICTGEGGFLITNDSNIYSTLHQLRSFGEIPGIQKYEYGKNYGMNYRFNAIASALGTVQLTKLDAKIKVRNQNANYILEVIKSQSIYKEFYYDKSLGLINGYALTLICDKDKKFNTKVQEYLKQNEIISDPLRYGYIPMYQMPLFSRFNHNCPNAEKIIDTIVTLPLRETLTKKELNFITKTFLDAIIYASN